jgi:AcrR family transcriptional regulator
MILNMSVHIVASLRRDARPSLLDMAAEVLVADPAASLAEVAEAAGIGRTTLHKHYATRDDLLRAVGHRAIDLWEQAVERAGGSDDPDGGLRALTAAMIPIGPQLAFLWRTPAFDHASELDARWHAVEGRCQDALTRVQERGVLTADVPGWWLLQTFYSVVYVAAESVRAGKLAALDAPGLAVRTFLRGLGASPAAAKEKP